MVETGDSGEAAEVTLKNRRQTTDFQGDRELALWFSRYDRKRFSERTEQVVEFTARVSGMR